MIEVSNFSGSIEQGKECSICLSGIKKKKKIKILPGCDHYFHVSCIDN